MAAHRVDPVVRFWAKVDKQPDGCWLWTAGLDRDGYGLFAPVHHVQVRAHRYSYELLIGPIPDGLVLDHVRERGCLHRHCVNPAHLEPVTNRENQVRGDTFGARNAAVTHCPSGHPYDEENTLTSNGRRICRTCSRARSREYQRAKRAA